MDHNVFREEISSAQRYRELKNLEMSILGIRNNIPISLFTELSGRVREKIMGFEFPECNASRVSIIYSNGLKKTMEKEECHIAMSRGLKLSDYICSHYVSARDYEIEDENIMDKYKKGNASALTTEQKNFNQSFTTLSPDALRERIDYLLKKVDNLEKIEKIYSENIPKIARDMEDLKDKVEKIYKRVVNE